MPGRYAVESPDGRRMYTDDPVFAEDLAAANRKAGVPVTVVDTAEEGGE